MTAYIEFQDGRRTVSVDLRLVDRYAPPDATPAERDALARQLAPATGNSLFSGVSCGLLGNVAGTALGPNLGPLRTPNTLHPSQTGANERWRGVLGVTDTPSGDDRSASCSEYPSDQE
jgi:hypothetical protein